MGFLAKCPLTPVYPIACCLSSGLSRRFIRIGIITSSTTTKHGRADPWNLPLPSSRSGRSMTCLSTRHVREPRMVKAGASTYPTGLMAGAALPTDGSSALRSPMPLWRQALALAIAANFRCFQKPCRCSFGILGKNSPLRVHVSKRLHRVNRAAICRC